MSALAFIADAFRGIRLGRELRAQPTSSLANPEPWLVNALNGGPTKSGATVNENTAFNVPTIRTCIGLRANLLSMLPVKVYRKTETGPLEQRDHPVARLLRGRVSPAHTSFKFRHCSQVCFDLGGNAYARVHRNAYAEVERIVWLRPGDVTPLENRATGAIAWRVAGQGDLLAHEVLHIANLSTNGRTGRSPLQDLRETAGLALTAEEFAARTFSNGNRKPGILIPPAGWKKEQADEFRAAWMQHYAGAQNAGKTPLIGGGMTWTDAGFSNQESELLGLRKYSKEEISSVFQIPLHLVNSTENSTAGYGANVEQVNQGLVDYMLQPLCENWEAEMDTTLLTEREQEQDYFIKFNVDALLRGSPETRAKVYQIMRGLACMSVNEIRGKEEMPLLTRPDGIFDDPRLPLNNQGGGNAAPAKQPAGAETE